jgi:FtsP/CotA-like multicopper oxidase with cupredoxin domain
MKQFVHSLVTRRGLLRAGLGSAGAVGTGGLVVATGEIGRVVRGQEATPTPYHDMSAMGSEPMVMPGVVGEVDHAFNGFDPSAILTDFDAGEVTTLPSGQIQHEYWITALNKEIELVPGIKYPAWTYNGRVPGPTIRAKEGERVKINFTNGGDHHHSMHFHGIHPATMDGVFDPASGQIPPGATFVYEFDAEPAGLHLYHCHTAPLATHIAHGLYGAFIIDPKDGWPAVDHEYVMVMAGFDIDFDGENDLYTVNTIPFHFDHTKHPIVFKVNETVRVFLVNILEYDLINSFHLHANFFNYYPTGTSRTPSEFTDTIALMQGQRGILEFSYRYPGLYMFHAHKTEFAELGWTGVFKVEE